MSQQLRRLPSRFPFPLPFTFRSPGKASNTCPLLSRLCASPPSRGNSCTRPPWCKGPFHRRDLGAGETHVFADTIKAMANQSSKHLRHSARQGTRLHLTLLLTTRRTYLHPDAFSFASAFALPFFTSSGRCHSFAQALLFSRAWPLNSQAAYRGLLISLPTCRSQSQVLRSQPS